MALPWELGSSGRRSEMESLVPSLVLLLGLRWSVTALALGSVLGSEATRRATGSGLR